VGTVRSSLRWRLAASYAGIALLTAVVLGGLLVSVLADYYGRAETSYLRAATTRVGSALTRGGALPSDLPRQVLISALDTQTRVRVYSTSGALLADSGSPSQIDPSELFSRSATPQTGTDGPSSQSTASAHPRGQPPLPAPLGSGFFGSETTTGPRSAQQLQTPLTTSGGLAIGSILLSDGPASGSDVLAGVVEALLLAGLVAVFASAVAGYVLSSRLSEPLVDLTGVADRMAAGDLAARAHVSGTDEVGRLGTSFNGMAERIEQTVTALRRFVADAAHEIGTPLTALQADLELAESALEPGDGLRFVERALVQARRLEDLSAGLLHLSRLEAGGAAQPDALCDAAAVVRAATDAAASRAEQAGVSLLTAVGAEAVPVRASDGTLGTIVDGLLDNAIKFTPSGGRVEAGVRSEGDEAVLWVADTGIGIPAAEQSGVFQRFYRARNVPAYPGSGLGLAIARATVERLSGSIGFESSDAGTRFEVRLPLA
jgi:signal transduction histidine kinase